MADYITANDNNTVTQPVSSGPSDVVCVSQQLRSLDTIKLMSVFSRSENCNCNKYTVLGMVLISLCHICPKLSVEVSSFFMHKEM